MAEHSGGTRGNGGATSAAAVTASAESAADRMVPVSVSMSPKHLAFLTAKAKRNGLTVSAMLRVMLSRWSGTV